VKQAEVLILLEQFQAIRRGHFQLSSGLHGPVYVQCALVLQYPEQAARLAAALVEQINVERVQAVVAVALGGILWGYELARRLGARALFVERSPGGQFELRRGFRLSAGERVLVAEDVLTTGVSTRETIALVRAAGGEVVGVAALVDRSGGRVAFDVPTAVLVRLRLETYAAADCPQCRAGLPVEKPGSCG